MKREFYKKHLARYKAYQIRIKKPQQRIQYKVLRERHGDTKGKKRTRLYRIWRDMLDRCYYPDTHPTYKEKGIQVCDEWRYCYPNFKAWAMTHGYRDDLTLDRIDNDKGYYPDNCRWATWAEQAANREYKKKKRK